jgi:hypothetical protein
MRRSHGARVTLELDGAEARNGVALASLEAFIDQFRRALVDFDRSRRAERTRRGGHPSSREQWVTAFRIVSLRRGSAIIELEPIEPATAEQEQIEAEMLAVANLGSFIDVIDSAEPLEPDVTESIAAARRALGDGGRIGVVLARGRKRRRVVIDEARIEDLRERKPRHPKVVTQVAGRLHMIDVDPLRVGIRAADGVEWTCRYAPELEPRVRELLKLSVIAAGEGVVTSAGRGEFEIRSVEAVGDYGQTQLFAFDRRPLEDLLASQGVRPQGWDFFADPEWQDDESSKRFLDALLDEEPQF